MPPDQKPRTLVRGVVTWYIPAKEEGINMFQAQRIRSGMLQVPTCYFESQTGSEITFFGMYHYGDSSFFATTAQQVAVNECLGHRVYYERIKETPAAVEALPAKQRALYEENVACGEKQIDYYDGLGMAYQYDEIAISPTWENHDMELVDYLRLLGAGILHETAAVIDTIHAENDTAEERRRYLRA